jgi:hypothetical protein
MVTRMNRRDYRRQAATFRTGHLTVVAQIAEIKTLVERGNRMLAEFEPAWRRSLRRR